MLMFEINRYKEIGYERSSTLEERNLLLLKLKEKAKERESVLNIVKKRKAENELIDVSHKIVKTSSVRKEPISTEKSRTPCLDQSHTALEYDPLKKFREGMKQQKQSMLVIGNDSQDEKCEVTQKLPEWMDYPYYVSNNLENSSGNTVLKCLDDLLQENLKKMDITNLFPVQCCLLPVILFDTKFGLESCFTRPSDICVCAPTGSGKTLAFALPIVHSLIQCPKRATRVLVVLPTVELAIQVHSVFTKLCAGSKVNAVVLGGSKSLSEECRVLYKFTRYGEKITPDIIISTPGRLVHHLETDESLDLNKLRFLVIDEADRIMDFIKHSWLQNLEKNFPRSKMPVQKLLFSATLSTDPEKLKGLNLFQPRLFSSVSKYEEKADSITNKYSTPPGLKEYRISCTAGQKPLVVLNLIKTLNVKKALCFTSTSEAAHRLSLILKQYGILTSETTAIPSFSAMEFSSQLTKKDRKRRLSQFNSGKISILVSSDSTARGIDVEDVEQVILYDAPLFIETYIHRVGRTSRAGKPGTAYTLIRSEEMFHFKKMFHGAGKEFPEIHKIQDQEFNQLNKYYERTLEIVQNLVEEEKQKTSVTSKI